MSTVKVVDAEQIQLNPTLTNLSGLSEEIRKESLGPRAYTRDYTGGQTQLINQSRVITLDNNLRLDEKNEFREDQVFVVTFNS